MVKRPGIVICILLLCGCSKDPHNVQITAKNKDTFMEEIKDMKGFTVDEARLLVGFQVRRVIGKTSGDDPTGKTVGDLLSQLKKQAADEKTEGDRQKRLADDAKAKTDARLQDYMAAAIRREFDGA